MKTRLDMALVEKGLFQSREKAKANIMAGLVCVDGIRIDKPGTPVNLSSEFTVKETLCPYVGRGGLKLEKALDYFDISLDSAVAMDMGASTGGFTDCMLQRGAQRVYSVDVGYGQLDWKLRNDSRVVNMEKTNIRYINADEIKDRMDFISIDVSFISLSLIFPVAAKLLKEDGCIIALVKPQFEAGREQVGKKGIVRDKAVHTEVIKKVMRCGEDNGLYSQGITFSPIKGTKGNIEYLLLLDKGESSVEPDIDDIVFNSHSELDK